MSEQTEDIDLVIEEDAPAAEPEIKIEDEPTRVAKVVEPEEGLERLKANLEQSEAALVREKTAREQAERRAHESANKEVAARNEVQDTNLSLVTNAIETVKQSTDMLKSRLSDCYAAGDWAGAADVQAELSTNAAKMLRLEEGKQALEAAPKAEPEKRRIDDPVEALASQLSPKSAAWVRAHPEYATDSSLYQRMIGADNLARSYGHAADSSAYFDHVEKTLGLKTGEDTEERQVQRQPPSAPVTREIVNGNGQKQNVVRLTAAEREMAASMNLTDKEYAMNKLALQKEGRMQ